MPSLKLSAFAVTTMLLLLGSSSSSWAATSVMRKDPGGAMLTANSTLTSTAGVLTLTTGTGAVQCDTGKVTIKVTAPDGNPSVTAHVESMTYDSCNDTVPMLDITECAAIAPLPTLTITAGAGGGTVTFNSIRLRCPVAVGGDACYYTSAPVVANLANVNSGLAFVNAGMDYAPPTGSMDAFGADCGLNGTMSGTASTLRTEASERLTITTS